MTFDEVLDALAEARPDLARDGFGHPSKMQLRAALAILARDLNVRDKDWTVGDLVALAEQRFPRPLAQPLDPEFVAAYLRLEGRGIRRPSQLEAAIEMGFDSEDSVRERLRPSGITDYRKVHSRIPRP